MLEKLKQLFLPLRDENPYEQKKLLYLAGRFFFSIGVYSVLRSLKTAVFLGFVGVTWQPCTKFISIIAVFPSALLRGYQDQEIGSQH